MATRVVSGTVYHPGGSTPWASASVKFRLASRFATASLSYPAEQYTATTDAAGAFSVALAVPDTGTALYECTLPDGMAFQFALAVGAATTLEALINAAASASVPQNTVQAAIDAHAAANDAHSLLRLTDTPNSYVGQGTKVVVVKVDESGVEFTVPAGVTDHGALTGLADDDHTQYHTDARGDARYQPLDSDLTAIAALSTTSYGRSLLATADAAAARGTLGAQQAIAEGRAKTSGGTVYECLPGVCVTQTFTTAYQVDSQYYVPILVRTTITVDQIVCEVTSPAVAGKTARMAIYNADTDWQPTSLVLDSGTVATDSNGVKAVSISQQLTPGRYLLAINNNGTPTLREYGGLLPGTPFTTNTIRGYYNVATAYGAYAGTGVAWTTTSSVAPNHYPVWLRVGTP